MDKDARIAALEERLAYTEEKCAALESALIVEWMPPVTWNLTPSEARVFGVLLGRSFATKSAILAALYDSFGKDAAHEKIVDVFVCKIRKKLRKFDVEIKTIWGQGYSLVDREFYRSAA